MTMKTVYCFRFEVGAEGFSRRSAGLLKYLVDLVDN